MDHLHGQFDPGRESTRSIYINFDVMQIIPLCIRNRWTDASFAAILTISGPVKAGIILREDSYDDSCFRSARNYVYTFHFIFLPFIIPNCFAIFLDFPPVFKIFFFSFPVYFYETVETKLRMFFRFSSAKRTLRSGLIFPMRFSFYYQRCISKIYPVRALFSEEGNPQRCLPLRERGDPAVSALILREQCYRL